MANIVAKKIVNFLRFWLAGDYFIWRHSDEYI